MVENLRVQLETNTSFVLLLKVVGQHVCVKIEAQYEG